jgi:alpha-tubulin suppressor-like RCC1 family protein
MRDAISIASGGATACVAKTACTDAAKPVDGITDATQVAVGNGHACALRKTGEVVCWGASDCGQAGGTVEAGKVCTPNTVVPPTTITWAK